MTELQEVRPGLWRWTAPHPEWIAGARPETPADWPRDVGCVMWDARDATVLIDPLVPEADEAFGRRLDAHIRERGLPVSILTTIKWHRRSRDELVRRYGARTSRAQVQLPDGVEAKPLRGAGETMFWLAEHRALVPGDRLMGEDGGLRLCPESWLRYLPPESRPTLGELAARMRTLLQLPIEMVLVSHGDPVLRGGRDAVTRAIELASG